MKIRTAAERDVEALRDIERAAGHLFATVDLDAIAGEEPAGVEELLAYVRDGRSFVVADEDDLPVGHAIVDLLDGARLGFRVLGGDELRRSSRVFATASARSTGRRRESR